MSSITAFLLSFFSHLFVGRSDSLNQRTSNSLISSDFHTFSFWSYLKLEVTVTYSPSFSLAKWRKVLEKEWSLNCIWTINYWDSWKWINPSMRSVRNFGHLQLQDWTWAPWLLSRIFPQLVWQKRKSRINSLVATSTFYVFHFVSDTCIMYIQEVLLAVQWSYTCFMVLATCFSITIP